MTELTENLTLPMYTESVQKSLQKSSKCFAP